MAESVTKCISNAISKARKVPKQPAILSKQKFQSSGVEEKNFMDARARYKPKKSKPGGKKEVKKAERPGGIKQMEMPVFFLIKLLILYQHLHLHSLYLAALFFIYLFYYIIVLDIGSEARYVCCQDCGLGI